MKQIYFTIQDIFEIPTAVIYNPDVYKNVSHVSIDSRDIKKSSLFIAIKGERLDGHNFIDQAVKNGASAIIIDQKYLKRIKDYEITVITVKDTTKALGDLARIWRKNLKAKVIGITGSAGKTTTKEILSALLAEKFRVNKTIANHNNHIGVPLTILGTNEKHNVLVAELGTNHFGEIPYTASILRPDYALITNIGDSHLEFLQNRKGVLKEKSALLSEGIKNKGKVFINNDDLLLKSYCKQIKSKITYAVNTKADYKCKILGFDQKACPTIEIKSKNNFIRTNLPISGEANVYNYLSAYAIATELGVGRAKILNATKKLRAFDKRLEVKNYKKTTLINDSYNANPDSMRSSLNILATIKNRKRKIAVLGDMFELGKESIAKHKELAKFTSNLKIDEVYSIGKKMKIFDQSINNRIKSHSHFTERKLLSNILNKIDFTDSVILVKGSRGMKMEDFVSLIQSRMN
jgi:UDP-N-acetylmuramoyl-tripeptide--D-alanyl-D-alanine ligase